MNIQQMRYVLEVEKTGSISQAAENLFMGQPNLSKAIKELEASLGIRIFKRTSKGVNPTEGGEKFLDEIKKIIQQIEDVESRYCVSQIKTQSLSVSVPHCWYYSQMFAKFVGTLELSEDTEINFNETDSLKAISDVVEGNRHIGIIRYHVECEPYFLQLIADQSLQHKVVKDFESRVLLSRSSPLAQHETIMKADLENCIEVSHGGCAIINHPNGTHCKAAKGESKRKICVHEQGSQLALLTGNPNTYMWCAPMPADFLENNGLVYKTCKNARKRCRDILIFPYGYSTNELEELFLARLAM